MGSPVLESTKSVFGKVFFEYMIFLFDFLSSKRARECLQAFTNGV
jgi:hypothetical protein